MGGLLGQSLVLKSQNNRIKFVALTVLAANHLSLSYEYSLSKNNSLGFQLHCDLIFNPISYYPTTYQRSGIHINYRYYFVTNDKLKLFGQAEFGYSNYTYGDIAIRYFSREFGVGPLVGIRRSIGSPNKWFVDFAIGFNFIARNYTMVKADWSVICDGIEDCIENHNPIKIPENKTLFKPRIILEFGYKF